MLLYQRFEIPDNSNWQPDQPVPARDCVADRDVFAYRAELSTALRTQQIAAAGRFIAEQMHRNAWHASDPEIFTAEGFLWVITDRTPSPVHTPPVIERLREAGLFPALPKEEITPPAPAVRQCPRCKRVLTGAGPLCSLCTEQVPKKQKKGSCLLTGLAIFAVLGVLVAVLIWAVWARIFSPGAAPNLAAQFSTVRSVIAKGDSTWLSWNVSGASAVTIDHGIGSVASHGSLNVAPSFNTTYTLTATGGGRQITREVTVDVFRPAPKPAADQPPPDAAAQASPQPETEPPQARSPTPAPGTPVSQARPPESPAPVPAFIPSAPQSPPAAPPRSGNLRCARPVPPGGQVTFENLPAGFLHFDVQDPANWRLLIRRQPDGGQTLILVSQSPQTLNFCAVRWSLEQ